MTSGWEGRLWWHRLRGRRIVHFLHIGKTGGNAIRAALGVQKDRFKRVSPGIVAGVRGHHVRLADIPEGDGVVFTLRDPIRRFVSAFNSRLRQGAPYKHRPWTPGEAAAFGRFQTPNALGRALSSSDEELRSAAAAAMREIGHLRRPYAYWLESLEYVRRRAADIVYVPMLETLDADFERLRELLHLPDSCVLPADDRLRHKAPRHMSTEIDDTARANLNTWFADDYRLLNGCREMFRDAWPTKRG